jgi:metal-responsive CopG/Arc/MetJ family transcriptional regulator
MKKYSETIRYTATLPSEYIDELKELVDTQKIPSVNYAIREAVEEYLVQAKKAKYNEQMKDAAKDEAFINRTMTCAEDFSFSDSEVQGEW